MLRLLPALAPPTRFGHTPHSDACQVREVSLEKPEEACSWRRRQLYKTRGGAVLS
jgi:hypothetical protein